MTFCMLVLLIAVTWLLYPIVGGIGVALAVAKGTRQKDAGFSFIPGLIVFPPLFLGIAMVIDYIAMPWGRWIIGILCLTMMLFGFFVSVRNVTIMRRMKKSSFTSYIE